MAISLINLLKEADTINKQWCFIIHSQPHYLFILYKIQNNNNNNKSIFKLSRYDSNEKHWYNFKINQQQLVIHPLWKKITEFSKYQNRAKYLKTAILDLKKQRKYQLFILWIDTQYLVKITINYNDNHDGLVNNIEYYPLQIVNNLQIKNINGIYGGKLYTIAYNTKVNKYYCMKYNDYNDDKIAYDAPQNQYDERRATLEKILNVRMIVSAQQQHVIYVLRWTGFCNLELIKFNLKKIQTSSNIIKFTNDNNDDNNNDYFQCVLYNVLAFFLPKAYIVFFDFPQEIIILYNIKTKTWKRRNSKLFLEELNGIKQCDTVRCNYQQQFRVNIIRNHINDELSISGFIRNTFENDYHYIPSSIQTCLIKKYYYKQQIEIIYAKHLMLWSFDADDMF